MYAEAVVFVKKARLSAVAPGRLGFVFQFAGFDQVAEVLPAQVQLTTANALE
ncbi:MAG: hypothetical protein PHW08_14535 [Kiritimatiellae bacterium]|nr:hypothetical protein [Kiritimatiellia bacterium]